MEQQKRTVGMVSLGCEKNRVDGEMMLYRLQQAGYRLVADAAMADGAIGNTCGFIDDAKQESIEEILELGKLKAEGKIKALVVTGCMAQRYQEEVAKELPEADAVLGIGANGDIVSLLDRVLSGERVQAYPDKLCLPLSGGRVQTTPEYFAYLKIAEGCDNCCSYCAIPLIRGRYRSRPMEDVLQEARELAQRGVKELLVIAQDTTRYGLDLSGKLLLPQLLRELCKIDGIRWIRLLYCYPEHLTDELLEVMAQEEKICKYIDLPLQHCNEQVLRAMNRKGSRRELAALLEKVRQKVPGVVVRTTFIVGFPGETEEQFEELAEFVQQMRFERMGCFAYSCEEGTPAARMAGQIDEDIKRHRQELLMEQQQEILEEYCAAQEGKVLTVLCEGYDRYAECCFGRSAADAPDVDAKVFFTAEGGRPKAGSFVPVRITEHMGCDLIGELARE